MEDSFLEEIEQEDELEGQLSETDKYQKLAMGLGGGLVLVICCWISSIPMAIWLWENGDSLF
jgi:hypothetical protein